MQKILLILLTFFLAACGSNSDDGGNNPDPIPFPAISAAIVNYVEMFEQRYNIEVNYTVIFDGEGETGGSGSAGTTVGICRIWSSGRREVLINKEWWTNQQRIARTLSISSSNYTNNVYNYDFTTLEQENNGELNINHSNISISADNISVGGTYLSIKSKSCNSGSNSCTVSLGFNLNEDLTPGTYSDTVTMGDKTINVSFTVQPSTLTMSFGEVNRKVLIFHELGHCSLNRPHDSRKGDGVSYPSNMPLSMMFPTINPISQYYAAGYNDYYEQELYDGLVSIFEGSAYQTLSMQYSKLGDGHGDTSSHNHDHGDCVKFMD